MTTPQGIQTGSTIARTRRGSLLPELAIATILLGAAMTMTVQVLGHAGRVRRDADHRQQATLEVGNLMERLAAISFDELTDARAQNLKLSETTAHLLPDAQLSIAVKDERPAADRTSKRLAVKLQWRGRSGEWEAPVRLVTWIERGRTSR